MDEIIVSREDFERKYISRAAYDALAAEVARLQARVAELEDEARWVSVKERMPEAHPPLSSTGEVFSIDVECFCQFVDKGRNRDSIVIQGWYDFDEKLWFDSKLFDDIPVTHWRYIKPPEAE